VDRVDVVAGPAVADLAAAKSVAVEPVPNVQGSNCSGVVEKLSSHH
jgi:hypothetical protein